MITLSFNTLSDNEHIDRIFIVADESWQDIILEDAVSSCPGMSKFAGFVPPGTNRQTSILNGLNAVDTYLSENINSHVDNNPGDTVIVHDAARPFLSSELLDRCYEALSGHEGVMPVLPMKDTVYLCPGGKSISGLLNRQEVFAGQAPELFLFRPYYEANLRLLPDEILKINGASEPAVMAGMDIAVTEGDELNFKVTTDADLKRFFERLKEEEH